jgi:2'-5' RNA ligase
MRFLDPAPEAPASTETAVIVPVPAAESLVEQHRRDLDPSSQWGVPAHVTVLYPFVEPSAVDDHVCDVLYGAIESVSGFACQFARTRWFGEDVLWLDPSPADLFRRLTAAVWAAFPEYPPFGGVYDDVIPHLTIGNRPSGLAAMQDAERALQPRLPVRAYIDRVLLIAGTQAAHSWRVLYEIPLAS